MRKDVLNSEKWEIHFKQRENDSPNTLWLKFSIDVDAPGTTRYNNNNVHTRASERIISIKLVSYGIKIYNFIRWNFESQLLQFTPPVCIPGFDSFFGTWCRKKERLKTAFGSFFSEQKKNRSRSLGLIGARFRRIQRCPWVHFSKSNPTQSTSLLTQSNLIQCSFYRRKHHQICFGIWFHLCS